MLSSQTKLKPRLQVVATKYSQSTPTQHTECLDDPPYSPAASTNSFISSVSWVAEKSAGELGTLLKGAYKTLREKEKNLLLAAEIGKSLLEHNQNLKRDYDKLLENVKNCENTQKTEEDDNNMRLISSKKAYDSMIESLEKKNLEIQHLLDQTRENSNLNEKEFEKQKRKLESEINILKTSLDIAGNKILELEENNKKRHERWKKLDEIRDFEQQQKTDDLNLLQELTTKMQELYLENKQLQSSKKTIEERLLVSLQDLEKLQENFEHFELTHHGYHTLQEAFERQTHHIQELNSSLEDHRQILSRLKEKGYIHTTTTSPSTTPSHQSLMGELEHAFMKRSYSDTSLSQKMSNFATMTERNLTSFYNAPADYAVDTLLSTIGIQHDRRPSAESLYDLFEPETTCSYDTLNLYPSPISAQLLKPSQVKELPKGLTHRILFHIKYVFRSLFRWCRFAIILVTAVFINLWKGPDLLLEKL